MIWPRGLLSIKTTHAYGLLLFLLLLTIYNYHKIEARPSVLQSLFFHHFFSSASMILILSSRSSYYCHHIPFLPP